MNRILSFAILLGAAEFMAFTPALAAVPGIEAVGRAAIASCPGNDPVTRVYHSDKIVFMIGGGLEAADPADQAALNALPRNVELDIKVRDTPSRVAHIPFKVLTFLGAVPDLANAANIKVTDVEYTAVVCPGVPPL